jgi:hypothetical protein
VPVLRAVLAALPASHGDTRLELLVELAFIGNADLDTHADAARLIAAEAARATGRRWETCSAHRQGARCSSAPLLESRSD